MRITQFAVVAIAADAAYGPYHVRYEGEHLYHFGSQGYRYDGFYSVDDWIVGAILHNRGSGLEGGFQFGSGPSLLPFRVDFRTMFGVNGMPKDTNIFDLSFDVR